MSERRYRALLCLVQAAAPDPDSEDGVRTEVFDPLAGDWDPTTLAEALADPGIELVFHAGRQDIAFLRRDLGGVVTNVFDTQVAAGFLGLGSQEGYEALVRRVLGVSLKGTEGFTRWDRRPLSDAQLAYAADDARMLLSLGQELRGRLEEAGRLGWAREECRALESASDERTPGRVFERLPRAARLRDGERAVAWELVEWRERTAEALDRPPGFVLPDQTLVELARRAPGRLEELEHVRGLPAQTLHRRGRKLLDAIERGKRREPPPRPPEPPARDSRDAPVVALAQALVRHRAREAGLAVELVATQAEIAALVGALRRGEDANGHRVNEGWRRELVGNELHELMAGRRGLAVRDGSLHVIGSPPEGS